MPAARLEPGMPEDVGIARERLGHVFALLERLTAEGTIPGAALLVARYGKVVAHRGFGQYIPLTPEDREPIPTEADTVFLIASLTKPVVAMAVLLLVERGRLLLDDAVSAHIPEFSGGRRAEVRIRHLLTHTSGLPDMLPDNVALRQRHAPLSAFVAGACATPLLYAPGSDCRYQSKGILLLGEIVERTAGVPLREFLQREFFALLGMGDSYLGLGQLPRMRIAESTLAPEEAQQDWTWNRDYWRDLGAPWGGMHATVRDYAVFLQMMLHGGGYGEHHLLGKATVAAALSNQTASLPGLAERVKLEQAWGLGWRLNQPSGSHHLAELASPRAFGHAGATGTTAWADPETGLLCVFFTNQPKAGRLLNTVSNAVAGVVVS